MKKFLTTLAAVGVLASSTLATSSAQADRLHHGWRGGHQHFAYGDRHRGRGYWRGGRWIALGVGAAIVAGAAAAAADRDCYWRNGYRYCD